MKNRIPTIILALLVSLFSGCSKRPTTAAWSSSASIVIEPGVAIGTMHSGKAISQVIAELGQPDQTIVSTAPEINGALDYTNIGLTVMPGSGGVVHSVGVRPPFAGRTKEGIGMGASRADIIKAYGEPTAAKPIPPNSEVLRYESLGVRFQLEDGKVDLIVVTFKTAK
jgi:hypothetical protein